jgi:hypothetical protein
MVPGMADHLLVEEDALDSQPQNTDAAQILIQLAQLGASLKLEEATARVLSPDFDPGAPDLIRDPGVQSILYFGEVVGAMVVRGVLRFDLVYHWQWLQGLWSRVRPAAEACRQATGEMGLYDNFEGLADKASDAHHAFLARRQRALQGEL